MPETPRCPETTSRQRRSPLAAFFRALIRLYRLILSPWVGSSCKYAPTCSAYALEAIDRHGAIKGGLLTLFRILRCNPWYGQSREDPVPEQFAWRSLLGYKRGQNRPTERRGHDVRP